MGAASFDRVAALVEQLSPREKIQLVGHIMETLEGDLQVGSKKPKRSLYGSWKDVSLSAEDIDEARQELWKNFPREDI